MPPRHREEVLNTVLAACLGRRGVEAHPETIMHHGRARPDVIAAFRGLRCAIEGKVADVAQARTIVAEDARKRGDQGVAHMAVGVVYPAPLRTTEFSGLPLAIGSAMLDFVVFTEAGPGDWRVGGINEMLEELRRAHETIVRDDVLLHRAIKDFEKELLLRRIIEVRPEKEHVGSAVIRAQRESQATIDEVVALKFQREFIESRRAQLISPRSRLRRTYSSF